MAACVPPGAIAVAGVEMKGLRGSPLFQQVQDLLGNVPVLEQATDGLVAWNGNEFAAAVRGNFTTPPSGVTKLEPGLVVFGRWASAAQAQHARAQPGEPLLIERAGSVARQWPVWAVFTGGRSLPLTGNAANLNRLLRATDFATLAARPTDGIDLVASGYSPTSTEAVRLEETVRALITLTAGAGRNRDLASLIGTATLARADRTVTLSLHVPPALAAQALRSLFLK